MPKYTLDEVIDIIKALTPEEKSLLQVQLFNILGDSTVSVAAQRVQNQSQSFGNVSISGGGNTVAAAANQAGGDANLSQSSDRNSIQNADLEAALKALKQLQQDIATTDALNRIEKATVEVPIKVIEAELEKPEPEKSLIDQAIASLQKGLEGVQVLAEPVMKVAALVAKAWMI